MQKILIVSIVFFSFFIFNACKKADVQFGSQFLDDGYTQIVRIDSFSADISTVYIDSFVTSARGSGVTGFYTDPLFGKIKAQSYFEIAPPDYVDAYQNTSFDSLILILKPNKTYYGDTLANIQVNVNRVVAEIKGTDDNNVNLYNLDTVATDPNILGSKRFILSPNTANVSDTISIRLDDNLGRTLLSKLQDVNDDDMKNAASFLNYFRGLRISSPTNTNLVFGFSDSIIMRLHYKQADLIQQSKRLDFNIVNKNHQFNNIKIDRGGTALQNLSPNNTKISSTQTGNTAFTQAITGCMAKITFPSIRDIYKLPNYTKMLRAQLIIRPIVNSYKGGYPLPRQLRLSTTNQFNTLGTDLVLSTGRGTSSIQYGNLSIDDLYGDNTEYTYDVTQYLVAFLSNPSYNNDYGLLLAPPTPAFETQFNRIALGNKFNNNGKIELQIYYAAVQ